MSEYVQQYDYARYPDGNKEVVAFIQTMVDANQGKITGVVFPCVVDRYNSVEKFDVKTIVDNSMKHAWGNPIVYALNGQTLSPAPTLSNLETIKGSLTREKVKGTNGINSNMCYINGQAISSYILGSVTIPADIVSKCKDYRDLAAKGNMEELSDTEKKKIANLKTELDSYFRLATTSDVG